MKRTRYTADMNEFRHFLRFPLAAMAFLALAACGNKGPLVMPQKPVEVEARPVQPVTPVTPEQSTTEPAEQTPLLPVESPTEPSEEQPAESAQTETGAAAIDVEDGQQQ